jgi:hypothetical protein
MGFNLAFKGLMSKIWWNHWDRCIYIVLFSCLSCLLSYIAVVLSSLLSPFFYCYFSFYFFLQRVWYFRFFFVGSFRFIQRSSISCEICMLPFQSYDQMAVIASWLMLRSHTFIRKVRVSRHGYPGWNLHYPPQTLWLNAATMRLALNDHDCLCNPVETTIHCSPLCIKFAVALRELLFNPQH